MSPLHTSWTRYYGPVLIKCQLVQYNSFWWREEEINSLLAFIADFNLKNYLELQTFTEFVALGQMKKEIYIEPMFQTGTVWFLKLSINFLAFIWTGFQYENTQLLLPLKQPKCVLLGCEFTSKGAVNLK